MCVCMHASISKRTALVYVCVYTHMSCLHTRLAVVAKLPSHFLYNIVREVNGRLHYPFSCPHSPNFTYPLTHHYHINHRLRGQMILMQFNDSLVIAFDCRRGGVENMCNEEL